MTAESERRAAAKRLVADYPVPILRPPDAQRKPPDPGATPRSEPRGSR